MRKRYRIPGTDLYIVLVQDRDFDIRVSGFTDTRGMERGYIYAAENRGDIEALGFAVPEILADPDLGDGGELEAVPE